MVPPPEKSKVAPKVPRQFAPPSHNAETVSQSPSKPVQVKRSLKKKTFNASKAINKAISKLEREASDARPQSVLKAIDALQKKEAQQSAEAAAAGARSGIGETTKKHLELLDIYHVEIWNIIKTNWAYNQELDRGNQTPKAIIIVKIMRDGEIRDIWFEERSGSSYFDASCLKAVKKSNPLPPLPEGIIKPFHEVGLRFDPTEMRMRP
jgi:colicin import membrane protein